MKNLLLLSIISFFILTISCNNTKKTENVEDIEYQLPKREVNLYYFETENGWGYDVEINGKKFLHQIHLPCDCGGEGFKTKEKATLAAEFLKKKIENNERSLIIYREQLDSLGAL
ncbi:MAG: hypothetical protein B6I20_14565 [Bacteroidetes bacterium 4572_117]|nr:MAG: hypothetical protein B6I20_14565 [Bacteroidetes bacterium 4572_117]